ncbi:MAG: EamA family transporter [Deltaproteobacteria bacterium]|nr:EamA family transporter [Deltaproteobacteria bacterium]
MKPVYLSLVTMVLMGVTPLFDKMAMQGTRALSLLVVRMGILLVGYGLIAGMTGDLKEISHLAPKTLFWIVLSSLCGIGSLYAYFAAIKMGEVSVVSTLISASPFIATTLSIFFFRETITITKVVGILTTVTGIVLLARS